MQGKTHVSRDKSADCHMATLLAADRAAFLRQADVSRETLAGLDRYADLLVKWQAAINLVGPATLASLWTRHFLDSLQVASCLGSARRVVDLGSGAGFPGCVLALALTEKEPGSHVDLVESNGKKAAFLKIVCQSLDLPVHVHAVRIEAAIPALTRPDVVTARALAPLSSLIAWVEPWLAQGTIGLFHKGRDVDKEIADAARYWDIGYSVIPSVVDQASVVLKLTSIARRTVARSQDQ